MCVLELYQALEESKTFDLETCKVVRLLPHALLLFNEILEIDLGTVF